MPVKIRGEQPPPVVTNISRRFVTVKPTKRTRQPELVVEQKARKAPKRKTK